VAPSARSAEQDISNAANTPGSHSAGSCASVTTPTRNPATPMPSVAAAAVGAGLPRTHCGSRSEWPLITSSIRAVRPTVLAIGQTESIVWSM